MNSSKKNGQLTGEEQATESMAIFVAGQVMGLMSQLNIKALERFYKSDRSKPGQGRDFRYRQQVGTTIRFHKALFNKYP
jgi:hypothetical protein